VPEPVKGVQFMPRSRLFAFGHGLLLLGTNPSHQRRFLPVSAGTYPSGQRCCAASASHSGRTKGGRDCVATAARSAETKGTSRL